MHILFFFEYAPVRDPNIANYIDIKNIKKKADNHFVTLSLLALSTNNVFNGLIKYD